MLSGWCRQALLEGLQAAALLQQGAEDIYIFA